MIAACGLLELARLDGDDADDFFTAAVNILQATDAHYADWGSDCPAIVTHCTGSYHGKDHNITMNYADFYFIEAILKLSGDDFLFW